MMEIEITQIDRGRLGDAGHARAHRAAKTDGWAIYCTFGPNWVWNYVSKTWDICVSLEWNPTFHERSYEEAKKVLASVRTKKEIEDGERKERERASEQRTR